MRETTDTRIERLERRHRWLVCLSLAAGLAIGAFALRPAGPVLAQGGDPPSLTVSQIEMVDENGIVRARLGSDIPDGVIQSKVVRRGSKVAGLILYDETGQERGGYVTEDSGNIVLTLDTLEKQAALFAAGKSGGAALRIWYADDSLDLRVDENGPSLHAVQGGQVAFHEPPVRNPAENQFAEHSGTRRTGSARKSSGRPAGGAHPRRRVRPAWGDEKLRFRAPPAMAGCRGRSYCEHRTPARLPGLSRALISLPSPASDGGVQRLVQPRNIERPGSGRV